LVLGDEMPLVGSAPQTNDFPNISGYFSLSPRVLGKPPPPKKRNNLVHVFPPAKLQS